eukprot:2994615-Rhodomonas_salina.1
MRHGRTRLRVRLRASGGRDTDSVCERAGAACSSSLQAFSSATSARTRPNPKPCTPLTPSHPWSVRVGVERGRV